MNKSKIHQFSICAIILALFASCISSQSFIPVKGSGMAVEKSFEVSGFSGIEVSGGFDVILEQGENESVVLKAQENLFEYIHVEVEQGILKIYTEHNIWPTEPLKASIKLINIDKLSVSGGGDVEATTEIKATDLRIEMSGGGDLDANIDAANLMCNMSGGGDAGLNGKAREFNIEMTGGGNLTADMDAEIVVCRLSGGGDLKLKSDNATEVNLVLSGGGDADAVLTASDLKCSLSGGGDVTLAGKATKLDLHLNGGGDVRASDLDAVSVIFEVSGGSDLHLNVQQEIKGSISGGGDVYYSGSPEIVSVDARGGSEVHKE